MLQIIKRPVWLVFLQGRSLGTRLLLTCIILIGIHVIIVEYATVFKKSSERLYERVRTKSTNIELVDWQAIINWMVEKPGNKAKYGFIHFVQSRGWEGLGHNIDRCINSLDPPPPPPPISPRMLQGSFLHKKQRGYKASIRTLIARPHQAQLLFQYWNQFTLGLVLGLRLRLGYVLNVAY